MLKHKKQPGFTIVELLIVIVVIAILAAVTIVAFNGLQQRSRDSRRASDIAAITKALELYHTDNGMFPLSGGSTIQGPNWSTTADGSWPTFMNQLTSYMTNSLSDPVSTPNTDLRNAASPGYDYAYYSVASNCGAGTRQTYLLIYRNEATAQKDTFVGTCGASPLGPYTGVSNYRVVK